jgi:uncharacterized protein with PQ loop repeat
LLRPPHDRGEHAATTATKALGLVGSVIISAALFPQYWEIYKHKEVIGISVLFMAIDMMGGIFNDLSLIFRAEFDRIAAVTYTLVAVSSHLIYSSSNSSLLIEIEFEGVGWRNCYC